MKLVQRMLQIQDRDGYLSDEEMRKLAREMETPLYRLQEVASFFPHFRREWEPPPFVHVKVCRDMSCHLAGAAELLLGENSLKQALSQGDKPVVVEGVSCLGRCDRAPAVCVSRHVLGHQTSKDDESSFHDRLYAGLKPNDLRMALEVIVRGDSPPPEDTPDTGRNIDRSGWLIDIYSNPPLAGKSYTLVKKFLGEFPSPIAPPPRETRDEAAYIKSNHPWLEQLNASGLQGMGGAGLKAFEKWRDVWRQPPGDKYIVCNGDESEPATFKDRELLLSTPHLVVEGVILAGLMTGATAGYIYIRHEYHEQIASVEAEIEKAVAQRVCGQNILNTGRNFTVEVFVSPGGYICGEQTALIEAMEDKRAQPRNRPPELQTNGLFDRPTVVNNVETLAWVPAIMHHSGNQYTAWGKNSCKGRRLFSLCGDVKQPGVFEVAIGTTLGELIAMAGGVKGQLKAFAPSGPSGGFLPARLPVKKGVAERLASTVERARARDAADGDALDQFAKAHLLRDGVESPYIDIVHLPLDLNFFRNITAIIGLRDVEMMLGAGLAICNETRDLLELARNCTQFFRNESCGKCVPCRIGSQKLVEIGTQMLQQRNPRALALADEDANPPDIPDAFWGAKSAHVNEFAKAMRLTAICGLGYVAPNPLNTVLQLFPDEIGK